ncbi:NYN domain-containing protein [Candidatus Kaiserbacteria bacterium]|nr:NYN domain-containing protein [Candidatus Kaiserbacteria bacterium]
MNPEAIRAFLEFFEPKKGRTVVIIDFANVDKWENTLHWKVGIQELARLLRHFSVGSQVLRRFYYGADYGPSEKSETLTLWSGGILQRAGYNRFEVIKKRVKYIHDPLRPAGQYQKKCDFDVEMALDLIKMRDNYDNVILFSGDGDLVCAFDYLNKEYGKTEFFVFAARGHIGKEIVDAESSGLIKKILYADDFEYRLNPDHGRGGGAHATVFRPPRR